MIHKFFLAAYVLLFILMIPITLFDLQLSITIYKGYHVLLNILSEMTYIPTFFVSFFAVTFFIHKTIISKLHKRHKYLIVFLLVCMGLVNAYMFFDSMRFLPAHQVVSFLLIIFMYATSYRFSVIICRKGICQFDSLAGIGIFVTGGLYIGVTWMKRIMNRPRLYMIIEDQSLFTHWFIPQPGLASHRDFYSLPSGHITFASIALWYILATLVVPQLRKHFKVTTIIVSIWVFMQSYIRVALGEHFVSDVVFSILLTTIAFHILYIMSEKAKSIFFKTNINED